ncbi:MAG: TolB family protein [bacterium]
MNADGTSQTNITNNPAAESSPNWSPDGTQIAFISNRDGNFEIYTMNADGTSQTNRTNYPALDADPAWSPDGTKIVFETDRDGAPEIYVMNADGSGQTNLSSNPAGEISPDWQPLPSKVTICHKPGTPAQKTLVIPIQALKGHLGHGDTIGPCQ